MPAHHKLEQFLDEYLDAAGIGDRDKTPVFHSAAGRTGTLTERALHRADAYEMVRRRAADTGLKSTTRRSFRTAARPFEHRVEHRGEIAGRSVDTSDTRIRRVNQGRT
jgi:hypothetical protein